MPDENEYYVHRIGRTGRARRRGVAYTLVSDYPAMIRLSDIAKFTKNELQILDMARLRELACCPSHEKRHDRGRPSNESR